MQTWDSDLDTNNNGSYFITQKNKTFGVVKCFEHSVGPHTHTHQIFSCISYVCESGMTTWSSKQLEGPPTYQRNKEYFYFMVERLLQFKWRESLSPRAIKP